MEISVAISSCCILMCLQLITTVFLHPVSESYMMPNSIAITDKMTESSAKYIGSSYQEVGHESTTEEDQNTGVMVVDDDQGTTQDSYDTEKVHESLDINNKMDSSDVKEIGQQSRLIEDHLRMAVGNDQEHRHYTFDKENEHASKDIDNKIDNSDVTHNQDGMGFERQLYSQESDQQTLGNNERLQLVWNYALRHSHDRYVSDKHKHSKLGKTLTSSEQKQLNTSSIGDHKQLDQNPVPQMPYTPSSVGPNKEEEDLTTLGKVIPSKRTSISSVRQSIQELQQIEQYYQQLLVRGYLQESDVQRLEMLQNFIEHLRRHLTALLAARGV